ncbi:MAG: hypothetical protein FWH46_06715, partial [Methanimicrococcus sp.]|nr:hypothetical protein [Methanimicrococcus sp.]
MNNNYILDKELLEKRLKALADTPYSGEINFGAMCYAPRRIPIVKYECEICGKITERNQDDLDFLKKAKEIVTELKTAGYDVLLDEREFCKYCPGEKSRPPNLIFI